MRSRFTALGLVALSSVVGCGGGYDGKSAPQSPSTGGYVAYPSPAATAGERRIEAAPRDTVLRGQAVAAREEALEASSATDSDSAGGADEGDAAGGSSPRRNPRRPRSRRLR